ncbi:hypothetical protein [Endothiovibrio diazotrophicus]
MKKFFSALLVGGGVLLSSMGAENAVAATQYTYQASLPDWTEAFPAVTSSNTTLSWVRNAPQTGSTPAFSSSLRWLSLPVGSSLQLRLLAPPGVDWLNVRLQQPNDVGYTGLCSQEEYQSSSDGDCNVQYNVFSRGWPADAATVTPPALTEPKIIYLTVEARDLAYQILSMTVRWHIADMALYNQWRSSRSWAGGTGDLDGLSNCYLNNCVSGSTDTDTPVVTPTPTPTPSPGDSSGPSYQLILQFDSGSSTTGTFTLSTP